MIIDVLMKDHRLPDANGVRALVEEGCNEIDIKISDFWSRKLRLATQSSRHFNPPCGVCYGSYVALDQITVFLQCIVRQDRRRSQPRRTGRCISGLPGIFIIPGNQDVEFMHRQFEHVNGLNQDRDLKR